MSKNFTTVAESKGIGCVSNINVKNCTYKWIIHNYSVLCATRENFRSPAFTASGDDFKWCLEHRISKNYEGSDVVSFVPHPDSDADFKKYSPVSGNLKVTAIDPTQFYSLAERCKEFPFKLVFNGSNQLKFEYRTLYSVNRMTEGDRLTVVCDLRYLKTNDNLIPTLSKSDTFSIIECSLSDDLERIRIDADFSDMTISVKDENYPVHKAILAARSSVFRAMFKSNLQESQKNHITIADIEQDIFEEVLRYIYTGKTENLEELAFELLPVADKYDLKHLKMRCEHALFKQLSADNAGKILILADMHNAKTLRAHTIQFIKRNNTNCQDFKNTEIWKVLTTSRPELMRDMLAAFFEFDTTETTAASGLFPENSKVQCNQQ